MTIMAEAGRFYDIKELSAGLGISIVTLQRYVHAGRLKGHKVGRKYLVSGEALRSFLEGA